MDAASPTEATLATVFACHTDGSTGSRVGFATLVGPSLVLMHPPVSQSLLPAGRPGRFRVGLRADELVVDVIDVVDIHTAPRLSFPRGESSVLPVLVFAELARPANTPVLALSTASEGARDGTPLTEELTDYLHGLPQAALPAVAPPGGTHSMGIFCWLNAKWCGGPGSS